MTTRIGGLPKYTKEENQKFEGTKLLEKWVTSHYPDRFMIKYRKFEQPKEFDLYEAMEGKPIELGERKIIFGTEAPEEEFTQYDFLWCPDGPAFVVHKRVLDKLNELCPDDIQALPMVIKNLNPKGLQFENKDFWLINVLSIVDAIDQEKSEAYWRGDFLEFKERMYLKAVSCLGGHKIARIVHFTPKVIFHPSLAKHFIKSRGILFLTDEEAP